MEALLPEHDRRFRAQLLEACIDDDAEPLEPVDRSALGVGVVTLYSAASVLGKWGQRSDVWISIGSNGDLRVGSRTRLGLTLLTPALGAVGVLSLVIAAFGVKVGATVALVTVLGGFDGAIGWLEDVARCRRDVAQRASSLTDRLERAIAKITIRRQGEDRSTECARGDETP